MEGGRIRKEIPTLKAFGEIVTIDVDPCRYSLSSYIQASYIDITYFHLLPTPSISRAVSSGDAGRLSTVLREGDYIPWVA